MQHGPQSRRRFETKFYSKLSLVGIRKDTARVLHSQFQFKFPGTIVVSTHLNVVFLLRLEMNVFQILLPDLMSAF